MLKSLKTIPKLRLQGCAVCLSLIWVLVSIPVQAGVDGEDLLQEFAHASYAGSERSNDALRDLVRRTEPFLKSDEAKKDPQGALYLSAFLRKARTFLRIANEFKQCKDYGNSLRAKQILAGLGGIVVCRSDNLAAFQDLVSLKGGVDAVLRDEPSTQGDYQGFMMDVLRKGEANAYLKHWAVARMFGRDTDCQDDADRTPDATLKAQLKSACQAFTAGEKALPRYVSPGKIDYAHAAQDLSTQLNELNQIIREINLREYSDKSSAMEGIREYYRAFNAIASSELGSLIHTKSLLGFVKSRQLASSIEFSGGHLKIAEHGSKITPQQIQVAVLNDEKEVFKSSLGFFEGRLDDIRRIRSSTVERLRDGELKKLYADIRPVLMDKYPEAIGEALLEHPERAAGVCRSINNADADEEFTSDVLDGLKTAGAAVGAAGILATSPEVVIPAALGGLTSAASAAYQAKLDGEKVENQRNIQYLNSNNPEFRRFAGRVTKALDDYDSSLKEAVIAGALAPADAVALYKAAGEVIAINRFGEKLNMSWGEVTSYLEDLSKIAKQQKEFLSIEHQKDLVEALKNPSIRGMLERNGFNVRKYLYGALDSDVGKEAAAWAGVLEKTDENLRWASVLRGSTETKSGRVMRELLDGMGFKGKSLINSELSDAQVLELLNKPANGVLKGYLHEFPGIKNAIRDFEEGKITEQAFKDRVEANLFHNGPHAGFWKFLGENLVPQFAENDVELLSGTVFFKGTKKITFKVGDKAITKEVAADLEYPSPRCFECLVHTFNDRLSQATAGGIKKIYAEIPGTPVAKARSMLVDNPRDTLKQVDALETHTSGLKNLTGGQKDVLQRFYSAGTERVKQLQKFIQDNSTIEPDRIILRFTDANGQKMERVIADSDADNAFNFLEEFMSAEERANGVAVQGLKVKAPTGPRALAKPVLPGSRTLKGGTDPEDEE